MPISHARFYTARATMDSVRNPENIFGCTLMTSIASMFPGIPNAAYFLTSLRTALCEQNVRSL